jgi:uncharacterized protein YkwD
MLGGMVRTTSALALLALATAIGLLASDAAPAGATSCPYTDTASAQLSLDQFDASMFCLINETRAGNGVQTLRPNRLLRRAATAYTSSLLRGRFFSHHGDFDGHPHSSTPVGRLREIGYVRPGDVWVVGEDLRWSTPDTSTPTDIIEMWLNSPIHRIYLLKPKFDELGVAGARGTPIDPNLPDGVTIAAEFGFRRAR